MSRRATAAVLEPDRQVVGQGVNLGQLGHDV